MARVYRGERVFLTPVFGPLERLRLSAYARESRRRPELEGVRAQRRSSVSALFWLALYVILRTQGIQPFNPEGFNSAPWDVTFNTTSSFISNTNWQYYGGETTLSYFSQMAGLAVQNFISAAVGIAVAVAVIRGFASRAAAGLGNFWQDLTRTLLYILLPISFVAALFLVSQGMIQNARGYETFGTLAGGEQTLALGPVASQEAIKHARHQRRRFLQREQRDAVREPHRALELPRDAAHPLIPAGLTSVFGRYGRKPAPGLGDLRRDATLFLVSVVVVYAAEVNGSPAQHLAQRRAAAGNFEGKEVRFGLAAALAVRRDHDRRIVRRR